MAMASQYTCATSEIGTGGLSEKRLGDQLAEEKHTYGTKSKARHPLEKPDDGPCGPL